MIKRGAQWSGISRVAALCLMLCASQAVAQVAASKLSKDAPIDIASDALEVLQAENKAIFTGNVIATQGNVNMRANSMTVFYRGAGTENDSGAMGKGIYRIDSEGQVIFASPEETAKGDMSVYEVDSDTITLTGNVLLTRGQNVLKGTKLVYNLGTGRSVLTSAAAGSTPSGGRVRGLFVPSGDGAATP